MKETKQIATKQSKIILNEEIIIMIINAQMLPYKINIAISKGRDGPNTII